MKKIILLGISVILIMILYYFLPENKLPQDILITKLIVNKSKRELLAYSNNDVIKVYTVSLGGMPIGAKEFEGDQRTPEGNYTINSKNPNSAYHKNLGISYPNRNDIKKAKIAGKRTGGDIKIHGLNNGREFVGKFQRWYDWTAGCIAVTNDEIDELYKAVKIGTPIIINP